MLQAETWHTHSEYGTECCLWFWNKQTIKQAPCEHLIGMNWNSCQKMNFSVEDLLLFSLLNNPAPKCTFQNKGKKA